MTWEQAIAQAIQDLGFVPAANCMPAVLKKQYGTACNYSYVRTIYERWCQFGILRETGLTPKYIIAHGDHCINGVHVKCGCFQTNCE